VHDGNGCSALPGRAGTGSGLSLLGFPGLLAACLLRPAGARRRTAVLGVRRSWLRSDLEVVAREVIAALI
jgi:hypothetical protein